MIRGILGVVAVVVGYKIGKYCGGSLAAAVEAVKSSSDKESEE